MEEVVEIPVPPPSPGTFGTVFSSANRNPNTDVPVNFSPPITLFCRHASETEGERERDRER